MKRSIARSLLLIGGFFLLATYQNCSPVNFASDAVSEETSIADLPTPSSSTDSEPIPQPTPPDVAQPQPQPEPTPQAQPPLMCGNKIEVNGQCVDFTCKEVRSIQPSASSELDIPARSADGLCYAVKLMDAIAGGRSNLVGQPVSDVISRNHDVNPNDPNALHNAYQMNRRIVDFKIAGPRTMKLTGSANGKRSITIDNFVLVGLYPKEIAAPSISYFNAYGTADSIVQASGGVLLNGQVVPLQPFESGGTSTIAPLDITTKVQVGNMHTLDVRAMDAGSWGTMSDVYLLFQ